MNIEKLVNEKSKTIPKYKWESFYIPKSSVELYHTKNDALLILMGMDCKFWLDAKFVETNPYTNDIKISIGDQKKYVVYNRDKQVDVNGLVIIETLKNK